MRGGRVGLAAFGSPGADSIGFAINGPPGRGTGTPRDLTRARPARTAAELGAVGSLPFVALVVVVAGRWTGPRGQRITG